MVGRGRIVDMNKQLPRVRENSLLKILIYYEQLEAENSVAK